MNQVQVDMWKLEQFICNVCLSVDRNNNVHVVFIRSLDVHLTALMVMMGNNNHKVPLKLISIFCCLSKCPSVCFHPSDTVQ